MKNCDCCGKITNTYFLFESDGKPTTDNFDKTKHQVFCNKCKKIECCGICGWLSGDTVCRYCRMDF